MEEEVETSENFNIIGDIALSDNEKLVLNNNPKLATLDKLDEAGLHKELEVARVKTRWDLWNNPAKYDDDVFEDVKETADREAEADKCMSRQVYDVRSKSLSFMGKRATDSKLNTHVFLPKSANLKKETAIQLKTSRLMEVAREYKASTGNDWTLSKDEKDGLDSLTKRTKDGHGNRQKWEVYCN